MSACPYCLDLRLTGPNEFCCGMQEEIHLALMLYHDAAVHGFTAVTSDGKRVDPATIQPDFGTDRPRTAHGLVVNPPVEPK